MLGQKIFENDGKRYIDINNKKLLNVYIYTDEYKIIKEAYNFTPLLSDIALLDRDTKQYEITKEFNKFSEIQR